MFMLKMLNICAPLTNPHAKPRINSLRPLSVVASRFESIEWDGIWEKNADSISYCIKKKKKKNK